MRVTMLGLIASLTLAVASPPTLAQPYPNPALFRASWVNLNSVVTALQNYFADFGGYPQSAVELFGIGGVSTSRNFPLIHVPAPSLALHPDIPTRRWETPPKATS